MKRIATLPSPSALRRTAAVVLAALFPAAGRLPGLDRDRADAFLGRLFREAPPSMRWAVHAAVLVFLATPFLTVGRPVPATWLDRERLDQHADALSRHRWYPLRQTVKLLKAVGGMAWGADDGVRSALGLAPYGPDPGTWRAA